MQNPLGSKSNETEMTEAHRAFLSLGSNIEPQMNLVRALELLKNAGKLEQVSTVWESESVGAEGPNYLNACALFITPLSQRDLKKQVLLPIEQTLGRQRTENRFAPRTIDIDIVLFDNQPGDEKYWEQAFVVVPLAEIHPDYLNPIMHEPISKTAARLRQQVWMEPRPHGSTQ